MDWLKDKIFNRSEVARKIGMDPVDFNNRLTRKYYEFTAEQIEKLNQLKEKIKNQILS